MDRINTYNLFRFVKTIVLLQIFILSLLLGISTDMKGSLLYLSKIDWQVVYQPLSLINIDTNRAVNLVKHVNVVMPGDENEVIAAASYLNEMPEDLLVANIKALEFQDRQITEETKNIELPAIKKQEDYEVDNNVIFTAKFNSDQKIVLYCTHNGETYIPDSGKARFDGKRGLIEKVAKHLSSEIKKRGVQSYFVDTIHDNEYSMSYTNSKETVKKIIKNEPYVLAIFDIHRDSIPGINHDQTIKINGKESAQILIVVGTDERKPHPNWRKNLAFAQKLYEEGQKKYPGLIRAVRTKAGTYNQEFHPRALLLEVGNDTNSFEQARYAVELFADILIEVLNKEVK